MVPLGCWHSCFWNLNFTVPAGGVVDMKSYVNSFWSSTLKEYQTWGSQLINFTVNWVYIVLALEVHFHINNVEKSILSTNFWPAPVKQSKNILSTKTFKVLEGKMYYFLSILSPVIYKSPSSLSLLFSVFMVICYVCMQYKHLPTSEPPFRSVIHWPEVQNVLGSLLIKCLYASCNMLACFVRPATCRQMKYHIILKNFYSSI